VGFGLRDSIVDIAKLQYHELQLYDANIILNTSASKQEQNNVEQELYWNDQVDKTAVGYLGQMKVKHGNEEQEVYLNEKKLDRTWITHEEIMNGGELKFVLSTRP